MLFKTRLRRLASATIITIALIIATPALADIIDMDDPIPTGPISRHLVMSEPKVTKADVKRLLPNPKPKVLPVTRVTGRSHPVTGSSVWDRLAQCESGGNWSYNGGSGFDGGLQFLPSTWRAAGGTKYAPYAYLASREQQIAVAKSWLARTSWSQWPACSRRIGVR